MPGRAAFCDQSSYVGGLFFIQNSWDKKYFEFSQILEYLHIQNELSWGCDIYILYTQYTHSLSFDYNPWGCQVWNFILVTSCVQKVRTLEYFWISGFWVRRAQSIYEKSFTLNTVTMDIKKEACNIT